MGSVLATNLDFAHIWGIFRMNISAFRNFSRFGGIAQEVIVLLGMTFRIALVIVSSSCAKVAEAEAKPDTQESHLQGKLLFSILLFF